MLSIQTGKVRTVLFAALLLLLPPCMMVCSPSAAHAQNIEPADDYEHIARILRDWIGKEIKQKRIPAFSIALVEGDRVVWAEGFGWEDADQTRPANAQTVYRVGSVSKLLNDVAVMQLVQQGKLSLDGDIREVLPDFQPENPFDKRITLRSLMNHTSGLVRESPVGNYFDHTEPTLKETIDSLNRTKVIFEPGSRTKYSNAAVSVAGYAIEHVTGQPYAEVLTASLLDPLEMNSSSFVVEPTFADRLAYAEMWSYDGRRFEAPNFRLGTIPAGNLYSNVLDLANFMRAIFANGKLNDRQVIDAELLAEMLKPQTGPDGQQRNYGIGFRLGDINGHTTFEHGGAVYGYATQFRGLPDKQLGVIAVASLDVANGFVNRVTNTALNLMDLPEGTAITFDGLTHPLEKEFIRSVSGRYANDSGQLELFENAGRLLAQAGAYQCEVRRHGDATGIDDVLDYGAEVVIKDDSVSIGDRTWQRQPDDMPAAPPAHFDGLIGEYGWDHNTLFIYEKQGQLWCLIEWVFHYPLTQVTEDRYDFPNYGLYHDEGLVFVRDDNGVATQVTAAEVLFPRRNAGPQLGETFKIQPRLRGDQLLEIARAADPPAEAGDFLTSELVDVVSLDDTIKLDIRYASTNNFMNMEFYKQPRAFMQRPAALALVKAHEELKTMGYGVLIHDAYRPWFVTKMFWEATPDEMRHFVADPSKGSRHNRGCAVDLTLYDLKTGEVIPMVAGYDEFTERAYPHYQGGTSLQRWHRRLLREVMQRHGFEVYEYEWWHFDYHMWNNYPIMNKSFEELEEK